MMDERSELIRWVAGRRTAEARERDEWRSESISSAESFARAMSLVEFAAARHGWPLPVGPDDEAEDLAFHIIWARIRRRSGGT